MSWWRRRAVPAKVAAVPLHAGEHRIAWAVTTEGAPVVVTDQGLRLPSRDLLTWEQIERVTFVQPLLTVTELTEVEGNGAQHAVALDFSDETDLPQVLRARVSASVAWSSHQRLVPAGGVRIVGRRRRGLEVLAWQLVYDAGTDPGDPVVRAQAEQHLAAARRTIG